jgi:hypothetical protein
MLLFGKLTPACFKLATISLTPRANDVPSLLVVFRSIWDAGRGLALRDIPHLWVIFHRLPGRE